MVKQILIVFLFFFNCFVLCSQNELSNKSSYKICKIDSTSFSCYHYITLRKGKEIYNLFVSKDNKVDDDSMCYISLKRRYILNLSYMNLLEINCDSESYFIYTRQIALKIGKKKIGGNYSPIYTSGDISSSLRIRCYSGLER